MPIGRGQTTNYVGGSHFKDSLTEYVQSFMNTNDNVLQEGGYDILDEPLKVMRRSPSKSAWKRFFTEGYMDTAAIGADPILDDFAIQDNQAMMEQHFENDVNALYEHSAVADYNPVMGMVFPMHKNILMNMVFDKGAIQKVVAESPKFTLTMETRILRDSKGNEIDMFLEQNKMTEAIDASNPVYTIELTLPEAQTTDILSACGGTSLDDLSIKTHIGYVMLENVYIAEGDKKPDANGVISNTSEIAVTGDGVCGTTVAQVWMPVHLEFLPSYNDYERSFVQPLSFTVRKDATHIETRTTTISGSMDHNKFNIFATNDVVKKVRLEAELDTSNAMLNTCSVDWKAKTTLIEIPNAIPINTTINPESVKDLAALYQVNQLTKVMSLFKTALANYKDDKIRQYLDKSYDRLPDNARGYGEFDYAVPEGYALDHVEYRYKVFFDFFDSEVTRMLQVLNDPNMVITVFGDPDLIRKITPIEYSYQTPSSIGPVELDYKRTVTTSDKRVYQFIGSDKLRWTDQLIVILCPRNSDRVTYRIYDYQMYVSNEIRNAANPTLPAIHAFERWLINEYQPVQTRITIKNRTGRRAN